MLRLEESVIVLIRHSNLRLVSAAVGCTNVHCDEHAHHKHKVWVALAVLTDGCQQHRQIASVDFNAYRLTWRTLLRILGHDASSLPSGNPGPSMGPLGLPAECLGNGPQRGPLDS
jgi:hypothetical protein